MKKKPSERIKSLWSIKLYKDDIEELLQLLSEYVFAVQLSDKKYEYTGLDEVQNARGDVIRDLNIVGTGSEGSRVQLRFSKAGTSLEVSNHDEAFLKIVDLLRPRKRILLALISLAVTIPSIFGFAYYMTHRLTILAGIFFVLSLSNGFLFMGALDGMLSVVYLTRKHEAPSFWKRNRDAIWIIVLTAVITALVSVASSYFLFRQGIK